MARRFWGITTYFNPAGSRTRLENYRSFRARSRRQGLLLLTVELAFDERPFELSDDDAERIVRRRSSAVLWQKERLLNLALEALPDECTSVCWVDADVSFEDDDWIAECLERLQDVAVLQPFSTAIRLPRGGNPEDFPRSSIDRTVFEGADDGTYSRAVCAAGVPSFRGLAGTTGYAWCAQRAVLAEVGFYDRCIVGGADRELALSLLYPPGRIPRGSMRIHHEPLRAHLAPWQARLHRAAGGRAAHRPGVLHHFFHGEAKSRRYRDRHAILGEHGYDPERDIALDGQGCWAWSTGNRALVEAVGAYFDSRNERD